MNDFIKNPKTRNARAFLPLNISAVGSVNSSAVGIAKLREIVFQVERFVEGWNFWLVEGLAF